MQTRMLGRTEVRLSEIALGTWGLTSGAYGKVEPGALERVAREALEHGVTTFDVAPLWLDGPRIDGPPTGSARLYEDDHPRALRTALRSDRGKDATLIVRAGQERGADGRPVAGFDIGALTASVDRSLARLERDRIDVLLLHNPPLPVLQSDIYAKAMQHLTQSGKVRAWGVSVGSADEGRVAMKVGAHAVCVPHHLLEPSIFHDLASGAKDTGTALLVRSPLCHGLLSGTWDRDKTFPADDHRSRRWDGDALRARLDQVDQLRFLVHDDVPDLATAALRFALASPFAASVIVGARTPEQIAHAAKASVESPPYLPDPDLARLSELSRAKSR
jgi:aryl-alcohol dehydrogenase-like predicted oxidoreductase